MRSRKVSFLYIGPPKSGSSWLYKVLSSSSAVYVPDAKDLYFFDRFYSRGVAWYENQFSGFLGKVICGELSHDYLYSKEAIERIKEYNPEIKFVGIFRDPVERSISHYKFSLKHGNVEMGLLGAAKKNPNIIELSKYENYLPYVLSQFPRSQILLIDFQDLKARPDDVVKKICDFLKIENAAEMKVPGKVNSAMVSRNRIVSLIVKRLALLMRRMGLQNMLGLLKSNEFVNKLIYKKGEVELSEKELRFLEISLSESISYYREINFDEV